MLFDDVRRLVRLVEESDIDELDVWKWSGRIRIRRHVPPEGQALPAAPGGVPAAAPPPPPAAVPENGIATPVEDDSAGLTPIASPMVGTLYVAPAPDADPFVRVGDRVEPGQTVCIVEAMKLMNEIQSEVRGKVVRRLVEDAQPVEFGQPLFLVQED